MRPQSTYNMQTIGCKSFAYLLSNTPCTIKRKYIIAHNCDYKNESYSANYIYYYIYRTSVEYAHNANDWCDHVYIYASNCLYMKLKGKILRQKLAKCWWFRYSRSAYPDWMPERAHTQQWANTQSVSQITKKKIIIFHVIFKIIIKFTHIHKRKHNGAKHSQTSIETNFQILFPNTDSLNKGNILSSVSHVLYSPHTWTWYLNRGKRAYKRCPWRSPSAQQRLLHTNTEFRTNKFPLVDPKALCLTQNLMRKWLKKKNGIDCVISAVCGQNKENKHSPCNQR